MGKSCIPFFIDNCVAASVDRFLIAAGHDVVSLRDCMPSDTKDPVIAVACSDSARVLISHDKDFKQIAKGLNVTRKNYRKLHRVSLRCLEPNAAPRMKEALGLIEWEWNLCGCGEKQMVIEITDVAIRVVR